MTAHLALESSDTGTVQETLTGLWPIWSQTANIVHQTHGAAVIARSRWTNVVSALRSMTASVRCELPLGVESSRTQGINGMAIIGRSQRFLERPPRGVGSIA